MKFSLTFDCDNSAFEYDGDDTALLNEVSRILRTVAKRVQDDDRQGNVRDSNGNTVGKFKLA